MFWPDVVGLKHFYASPAGGYAAQLIRLAVRRLWPVAKGEAMLGIGYAAPYLVPYLAEADHLLAVMPASQGVVPWPAPSSGGGANRTLLSDETMLPLRDGALDRILLVHVLEHTEQPRALLDECWRVLAPGGKILIIVPNRRGLWVRAAEGPFAFGRGFSPWQVKSLLSDQRFTFTQGAYALWLPPTQRPWVLKAARFIEGFGRQWFWTFGGVLLIEGEKQVVAPIRPGGLKRLRIPEITLPGQVPALGRLQGNTIKP